MSEQPTYRAKGTSLVVLLLLVATGIINKSCKSFYLPPKLQRNVVASLHYPGKGSAATPAKSASHHTTTIPGKKGKETPSIAPIAEKESTLAHALPVNSMPMVALRDEDSFRHMAAAALQPTLSLQLRPDEEIELLQADLNNSNSPLFRMLHQRLLDTAEIKNSDVINGKLADNSGSSYFNASIQTNINDQIKSPFTARLLYDSVIARSNKEFIYNTVTLTNNTSNRLEVQVVVVGPKGWSMVTSNIANIVLEPLGNSIIPMRFTPSANNTAVWQDVRIEYRIQNITDTRKSVFRIKVQEYSGFKASLPASNKVLTGYQKANTVPVYVKNSGNTPGTYSITAVNQLLKLNSRDEIVLNPGMDTTWYLNFNLSESQFAMLRKEDIRIAVANEKKEVINMIQSFSKVGYMLKDHASAYLEMPLQLEAGTMYQGSGAPIQYWGAVYGSLELSENDRLSMSFRSNTIAQGQTNNNSIVRVDYNGRHISASAGNIQGAGEFMVDGYGARLGYEWKGRNKAEVYAMLKSRVGDAKVGGGALQLSLKENINTVANLAFSKDNVTHMNSGIVSQITEYKFEKGKFALIAGAGGEKNEAQLVEGTRNTLIGSSLGYNFQYTSKKIAAVSNVLYNSNNFPGTFKGQRLQMHDFKWLLGSEFVGGYYEYNYRKQSYWQDTLLYENIFNLRTTNYGLRGGVSFKGTSIVLAAGNQRQEQGGEGTYTTNFDYLNLNIATVLFKKLFININSFAGNISNTNGEQHKAFASTNQGNIQYKTFGASFRYDKGPYYYQDFVAFVQKPDQEFQRIMFSPFAEVHLFKKALSIRSQANYAQSLPSDISNTSVLGNINYATKRYDFNINGIIPVDGAGSNQAYINAAFRMRLSVPFLPVRKFYNLVLILFKDQNSNGQKDAGEEAVAGQTLSLNGDVFVSDGNGHVVYKNTEAGVYKADFGYSSKLKGWMPNDGTLQYFELKGNRTYYVPYKVSRVLSGKLIVEKDELSNSSFTPGNIKVTATGQKGEVYATLTDENGEFYFNLPAGEYVVTLSEVAFGDQFRPVEFSQPADLVNNQSKMLYFEIKQKKRQINIRKR